MASAAVGYRALLARPSFRALWGAGGLTLAVIPVVLVILVWTVTQAFPSGASGTRATDVAFSLSLLGLSATVPTLLAAVVSGTLADRWPRKRLMQGVNLLGILGLAAALAILVERPTSAVTLPFGPAAPLYLILLFPCWSVISAAATLFRPALNASMPRVVPSADLGAANGALYALGLGGGVAGSIVAPILLIAYGPAEALAVPLGFLLAAQVFLATLDAPVDAQTPRADRRFRQDLLEGYRYLGQQRGLLGITVAALAINFLAAIAFVELGLYVAFVLGVGQPVYLGALYAGASVGAAVGTLAVAKLPFEAHAGKYLAVLAVLQGTTVLALSVIRWYPAALGAMFLYGLLPGMSATVFFAFVQASVRNDMLGRVLAADEVGSYSLVPIGQYVGGLITLAVGVSTTFLLGGLGILIAGLLMASFPAIRSLGFRPSGQPPPLREEDPVAGEGSIPIGLPPGSELPSEAS